MKINLHALFKRSIIESMYYASNFDGKIYINADLQICHILSKSKRTIKAIMNKFNCSKATAELIRDMPLLNTVVGTAKDNKEYKKSDDIKYIDYAILDIVYDLFREYKIIENKELHSIPFISNFLDAIRHYVMNNMFEPNRNYSDEITTIQKEFQRTIDLYF